MPSAPNKKAFPRGVPTSMMTVYPAAFYPAMGKQDSKTVTLRDVGRALGLSHVTVSLALRNSSRIPAARRAEIRKMADEMGYRPNAMAAALAHHRLASQEPPVAAAIAWLNFWEHPEQLRSYAEFDAYWRGASSAAEKFGYRLDEFLCGEKSLSLERLESILLNRGINGILLPPQRLTSSIESFAWEKFSVVRFGRSLTSPMMHLVTADQVANAMLAFERARSLGYRRVGFVSGSAYRRGALFEAGYHMAQRFVPITERLPILQIEQSLMSRDQAKLERWLKSAKPDAILTDIREASEMLEKAGCKVPDDIGLAAMTVLDGNCDSGINQNPGEIGRVALLVLVSLIHDGDRGIPEIFRQILVEGSWVQGTMMPDRNPLNTSSENTNRPASGRRASQKTAH